MDCGPQTGGGQSTACRYTYKYASLMGVGDGALPGGLPTRSLRALKAVMRRVSGTDDYEYDELGGQERGRYFAVDALPK